MGATKMLHIVGLIVAAVGAAMLASAGVAWIYGGGDAPALLAAGLIAILTGGAAGRLTARPTELTIRESYLIVTLAWLGAAVFGALPFWFAGACGPLDAFFESISGFTTTGASIFPDPGALPKGLQFWRDFSQWLGGMGIIVLVVAVLPYLGVGGMQLFRAEVPGPTPERLQPRIKQTATILWRVYVLLTALQAVLYTFGGMSLFDAVTHAFGTMPTGGFSPRTESLAYYSAYHQYVTIIFMYLAGVNFALHYRVFRVRSTRALLRDEEWRFYSLVLVGALAVLLVAHVLAGTYDSVEEMIRASAFQVVAIGTTTGFATADYVTWPAVTQVVLFFLMFVGGMAGSTGGGMKTLRLWAALKQGTVELRKHLHPRAVIVTRVGGRVVPDAVMLNILGFMLLFVFSFVLGALALTAFGVDMVTAAGAAAAAIGNIGPGLASVGPTGNYAWMPGLGKLVLSLLMLLGRLEIYTVLVLFQPEFWKR
ncbi:MAG: TrkH family potassium uptake protein [Gemmatimonadetes bacterium]|uniref:TrkH family potassium uptake protein n=1 Tax=Candidatus Kutchimonas denitrificans TaxID=3056748 RepID=A0AAE5CDL4_9BACT|nr:TrkH family potassium uptake protein [Gemmatimonadota bacterium]NIR76019.1 TrkH family potassium uptake protein [Candidatus Kutchimonas denitrificans]NIS02211.1 TrkH family potassium uptake protein [Gemmatimonadota bacterium]NIT68037.1 TrkH family potassium uptake protein [Gemmatimonadota bacterium]NIU54063.1 TrkH family potassium uptake protein [Gemmatimonadota bacterium]